MVPVTDLHSAGPWSFNVLFSPFSLLGSPWCLHNTRSQAWESAAMGEVGRTHRVALGTLCVVRGTSFLVGPQRPRAEA